MKQKTFERAEAERMAPLLQSMAQEIRERTQAIVALERQHEILEGAKGSEALGRFGEVRSQLSTQRRELRHVRKEVERLGLAVDDGKPPSIVVPGDGGDWVYSGSLDDTNFFRLEQSPA